MARRPYWQDSLVNLTVVSGGQTLLQMLPSLDADERRGITVARTIVDLRASSLTAASDGK